MMSSNKQNVASILLMLGIVVCGPSAIADDAEDLTAMLNEFLAGAGEESAHERFWAEDLVYTSSSGTRTYKTQIMQGFSESDGNDGEETGPVYTAEEIRIKLYGSTAVVAFKLVATPVAGSGSRGADALAQNYFNTGTFVTRDGIWQVVAWQATKIPD